MSKSKRQGAPRSAHERNLEALRRARIQASEGREVSKPCLSPAHSVNNLIVKNSLQEEIVVSQEKEKPLKGPLDQLREETACCRETPELNREIAKDPTISYEQVRDAIREGIGYWSLPGKERG